MGGKRPLVVVVGSINMDLVARVGHLPRPGETLSAHSLLQAPGGKGANQAVAVSRMGARCAMVGRVRDDPFGAALVAGLRGSGVATDQVAETANCPSGIALIHVDDAGQNAITVVAGANGRVSVGDVDACQDLIAGADALLVQLEIPLATVERAIDVARRAGVLTVLDPAPVPRQALAAGCLAVDVLSPNQTEAEGLCGVVVKDSETAALAAIKLQEMGAKRVVIKLGAQGAYWRDETGMGGHVKTRSVEAVDTTAAGDAFTGALTVSLAEGVGLEEAARRGCAAGTLAVLVQGAQGAMPEREAVLRLQEQMR